MNRKLFLSLFFIIVLVSCTKNASEQPKHKSLTGKTAFIKEVVAQNDKGITQMFNFEYNDDGTMARCYGIDAETPIGFQKLDMTFERRGKILLIKVNGENGLHKQYSFDLNDDGFVISGNFGGSDTHTTFTYDMDGHLTKEGGKYPITYIWNNGNMVSVENFNSHISSFEYGLESTVSNFVNPFIEASGIENYILGVMTGYFGVPSKNLVKDANYSSYELDSENRIVKLINKEYGIQFTYIY